MCVCLDCRPALSRVHFVILVLWTDAWTTLTLSAAGLLRTGLTAVCGRFYALQFRTVEAITEENALICAAYLFSWDIFFVFLDDAAVVCVGKCR